MFLENICGTWLVKTLHIPKVYDILSYDLVYATNSSSSGKDEHSYIFRYFIIYLSGKNRKCDTSCKYFHEYLKKPPLKTSPLS